MLLSATERQSFIELLRRPNLSALARKSINKKINEKCKKVSKCPHCGSVNGECVCVCVCVYSVRVCVCDAVTCPHRHSEEVRAVKDHPCQVQGAHLLQAEDPPRSAGVQRYSTDSC